MALKRKPKEGLAEYEARVDCTVRFKLGLAANSAAEEKLLHDLSKARHGVEIPVKLRIIPFSRPRL